MTATIGGVTYFFDADLVHGYRFWKAAFMNIFRLGLIESFEEAWELLLNKIE